MNIFLNKYDTIENLIFKEGLIIVSANVTEEKINIQLNNDHSLIIPLKKYPSLSKASYTELRNFQIIGNGTGIHWSDIDEDLSLKGFLKDYLKEKIQTEKELILS